MKDRTFQRSKQPGQPEIGLYYGQIPKSGPYRVPTKIDWQEVDWSRSDERLADELGVSKDTVRIRRKQLAPETRKGRTRPTYDWTVVDWSLRDAEIAKIIGCSPDAVAYQRQARKEP